MDLKILETFLAVAQARSFSQAAQSLNLTQPAITKRIQALEHTLNTPLFDRIGKQVQLTSAGEVLAQEARALINQWSNTQRQIANITDQVSGPLRIATSHHIGLHRLAPVLKTYREQYPDVALNITFEDSEVAHELLRRGDIEVAVVTLDPSGAPGLAYTPIWNDPLQFVATPGWQPNAWPATRGAEFSLETLAKAPCILPGIGTFTGRIVLQRFDKAGINLNPVMSTNYLETISMLVNVGLGWSVLPQSMVQRLETLDVHCDDMSRTLGCVIHPARALSNAARAFYEVVCEAGD